MNRFFYIKNENLRRIALAIFISWFFGFYQLTFFMTLIGVAVLLLFRRKRININDIRLAESNIILSPIKGKVKKVKEGKDSFILKTKQRFYEGFGLYLPLTGEIKEVVETENSEDSLFPKVLTRIIFFGKDKEEFCIEIESLKFLKPEVFVRSGDRGRTGAEVGYIPFGGEVNFEIPTNYGVICKKGDMLSSAQSVVAKMES